MEMKHALLSKLQPLLKSLPLNSNSLPRLGNLIPHPSKSPAPNSFHQIRSTHIDNLPSLRCISTTAHQEETIHGVLTSIADQDEPHLTAKLLRFDPTRTQALAAEVIRRLNHQRSSALWFFNRVLKSLSGYRPTPEIHNLVVCNLGFVDDYGAMSLIFQELSTKGHCLMENAFAFLDTRRSSSDLERIVPQIINLLIKAGGSCCGSGIHSLIKILCSMGCFDLAISVMDATSQEISYYNIIVATKCRNGDFRGAHKMFDEMRIHSCLPSTATYNYLLGSLFKNKRFREGCELLEEMEKSGCLPDEVTYEILAVHACKDNRIDFAVEVLDQMLSRGLNPRASTHAVLIKGYVWSGKVEDACKYVVVMSERDKWTGNMNYCLLVNLLLLSGKVVHAARILHEMMEKGLKPNFTVYVKVDKQLYKMGYKDLASKLKSMHSKFDSNGTIERFSSS